MFRNLPIITFGIATVAGYSTVHRHLFGTQSYHKKMSYYREEEKPFDEKNQKIIDELIDYFLTEVDLHPADVARLNVFWSKLKDPIHFGSHYCKYGAFVGVPVTFGCKSKTDVDLSSLNISDMTISGFDTDAEEELLDALVLSDDAKRFALASEFHGLNSYYIVLKLQFVCCLWGAYVNGFYLGNKLTSKPMAVQVAALCVLIALWYGVYYVNDSAVYRRHVLKADKKTAEMGDEYLDAGIEYLTKLQQRNKALRKLQENGEQIYKETGDQVRGTFETTFVSLSTRLEQLKRIKLNKQKAKEAATEEMEEKIEAPEEIKLKEVVEEKPEVVEAENTIEDAGILRRILRVVW